MGNVCPDGALLRKWFAERNAAANPATHRFEGAFRHANQSHAMMDASRSQAALGDFETTSFTQQNVAYRHADIFEPDFGMAVRRIVVAKHRQHPLDPDAWGIHQ